MRRLPVLVQSEGSERSRVAPASSAPAVVDRLSVVDQSASASSIIFSNQRRRAEIRTAVGRAWFLSSSSVGIASEVPSAGPGGVTIMGVSSLDRRPPRGMRVESSGRGARRGAGGAGARSTCARGRLSGSLECQAVWSMTDR